MDRMHCVKTRNFSLKYTTERMKGQQQIPRPNFQIMHLKRTSIQNIQKRSHLYKKKTKHPVKSVNKIGTGASGEPWVAKTIRKTTLLVIKETQMKTRRYHDAPTRTARRRKTDLLSVGEEVGRLHCSWECRMCSHLEKSFMVHRINK